MSTSTISAAAQTSVFELGKFKTELVKVETSSSSTYVPPPKPLLIFTPTKAGEFPVVLLLHGYLLYNSFYSQLSNHIASHGYIVVVPQLYSIAGPDASEEVISTAAITNWLPKSLQSLLPPDVHPNLSKLALSGHSRGGKVAFALALNKVETKLDLNFSALIGIDPVDGLDQGVQTLPKVLTYVPHSFNVDVPVMVIGSGLGEVKRNPLFPPCAPKRVNHRDFYEECSKPACHFVAKDYGHVDILDDETTGIRGKLSYCLCKNGKTREPMRKFVGGLVVAFLKGYLEGDSSDLLAIKDGHEAAPVVIEEVDFLI